MTRYPLAKKSDSGFREYEIVCMDDQRHTLRMTRYPLAKRSDSGFREYEIVCIVNPRHILRMACHSLTRRSDLGFREYETVCIDDHKIDSKHIYHAHTKLRVPEAGVVQKVANLRYQTILYR